MYMYMYIKYDNVLTTKKFDYILGPANENDVVEMITRIRTRFRALCLNLKFIIYSLILYDLVPLHNIIS